MNDELPEMPVCPRCSVPPHAVYRPVFNIAHRKTKEAGERYGIYVGCAHFRAVQPATVIPDAARAEVEERWRVAAEAHFNELTATWTVEQRESLRHRQRGEILLPITNYQPEDDCPI